MTIIEKASRVIRPIGDAFASSKNVAGAGGSKVAISCTSGRGRSGTVAALIAGRIGSRMSTSLFPNELAGDAALHDAYSSIDTAVNTSELVDIIVRMRQHRDGLVETPEQFSYIYKLLQKYKHAIL